MLSSLPDMEGSILRQLQAKSHNILARLASTRAPYVLVQHNQPQSELAVPKGNVLVHVARAMTEAAVVNQWEVTQVTHTREHSGRL